MVHFMKYQKILSMLVALTGFSVFSGANADSYTTSGNPTQIVVDSSTTLAKSTNYSLTFNGSSATIVACLLVPLYPSVSGSVVFSLAPILADAGYYDPSCTRVRGLNYSGVSSVTGAFGQDSIVPGSVSMTDLTNGRNVPIVGQGMLDSYVYYYAFHTANTGGGTHILRVNVSRNLPYITVPGTYHWNTGGEQGIGVPYGISYLSWQSPSFVNNVNTKYLGIHSTNYTGSCDITEQCSDKNVFAIGNASAPAQAVTTNFSYTSNTAGSTCPAGFSGKLKYSVSGGALSTMTPGMTYSGYFANSQSIQFYYEVPKSSAPCVLKEALTLNVSIP